MLLCCTQGIVVKVVNYQGVSVCWQMDVEFEKKGYEC